MARPVGITVVTLAREEYDRLKKRDAELARLEAAGVDNWEGYFEARGGTGGESAEDIYGEDESD